MSMEQLAEAMRQEKMPKCCGNHPDPVFYDEPECPACAIIAENAGDLLRRYRSLLREKKLARKRMFG